MRGAYIPGRFGAAEGTVGGVLTEGDGLGLTADVGARTTATAEPGPDPRPRHGFRWTTHLAVWTLQLPIALFFANSEAWRVGWSVSERFPRSGPSPWLVFACLSLMLVAIATHEAGHRLALVSVGRPSSMLIAPLGGMVRADDGLAVTATVAAAGPVASLGLAATAWAVAHGVTGFAPTTGLLLPTKCSTNLRARGSDVDVGNAAVRTGCGHEAFGLAHVGGEQGR